MQRWNGYGHLAGSAMLMLGYTQQPQHRHGTNNLDQRNLAGHDTRPSGHRVLLSDQAPHPFLAATKNMYFLKMFCKVTTTHPKHEKALFS